MAIAVGEPGQQEALSAAALEGAACAGGGGTYPCLLLSLRQKLPEPKAGQAPPPPLPRIYFGDVRWV